MKPGWPGSHLAALGGQVRSEAGVAAPTPLMSQLLQIPAGAAPGRRVGAGGTRQRSGPQVYDVSVAVETLASLCTRCSCRRPPGWEGFARQREAEGIDLGPAGLQLCPRTRPRDRAGYQDREGLPTALSRPPVAQAQFLSCSLGDPWHKTAQASSHGPPRQ